VSRVAGLAILRIGGPGVGHGHSRPRAAVGGAAADGGARDLARAGHPVDRNLDDARRLEHHAVAMGVFGGRGDMIRSAGGRQGLERARIPPREIEIAAVRDRRRLAAIAVVDDRLAVAVRHRAIIEVRAKRIDPALVDADAAGHTAAVQTEDGAGRRTRGRARGRYRARGEQRARCARSGAGAGFPRRARSQARCRRRVARIEASTVSRDAGAGCHGPADLPPSRPVKRAVPASAGRASRATARARLRVVPAAAGCVSRRSSPFHMDVSTSRTFAGRWASFVDDDKSAVRANQTVGRASGASGHRFP
jgi:hypothetical protein